MDELRKTQVRFDWIKKTLIGIAFLLIGCASTGVIKGQCYTDNTYPITLEFPGEYTLKTVGTQEFAWRIAALKWFQLSKDYYRPRFAIAIVENEGTFYDFIEESKTFHQDKKIPSRVHIVEEEDIVVNDLIPHLVYFSGLGIKGVSTFLNFKRYYMMIEYITAPDYYDFSELMSVLESIKVIE